jgi:DNA-binding CsgD family transcriptional regulator
MTFESIFGLHYLYARGRYNLAVNQPSAALDNFEACGELMKRWQIGSPAIVPWPAGAAHSLIMLGDQRSARELATKQLTAMDGSHRRSRGACLRVLGLTSELRERRQMLSEAVDVLEEAGDRIELAYALHDLSKTLHALGHSQRARLLLHRTRRLAEECQITLLNREPDGSAPEPVPTARTSGNGTELPGVLSEAERRVAMLAAQGSTNWDIARKLYITVSTVEQHLTRAYRKLKVSNRSDLAAIMTADSCQEHESAVG